MKRSLIHTRRQGAAIIAALVAMAIVTALLSVVTLQVVSQRQVVRQRQRQLQAQWLARAGVELATARLLEKPSVFKEENEDLLPDTKVRIVVEKAEPDVYAVSVEAEVGLKDQQPVVRTQHERFRRTDKGGVIRLEAIAGQKKE
jgi:type II secretory pathway pseudopilin PulG